MKLELFKNRVQDNGAMLFADMLRVNSTLRDLNLRQNEISCEYTHAWILCSSDVAVLLMDMHH